MNVGSGHSISAIASSRSSIAIGYSAPADLSSTSLPIAQPSLCFKDIVDQSRSHSVPYQWKHSMEELQLCEMTALWLVAKTLRIA